MIRRCVRLPPSLALLGILLTLPVLPAHSQVEANFRDASKDYFVGLQPTAVGMGDFDGDGVSDLAVANTGDFPGTVSILLGNGDGTFRRGQKFEAGSSPASLITASDCAAKASFSSIKSTSESLSPASLRTFGMA